MRTSVVKVLVSQEDGITGEQGGTADEPEDSYADSKQSFDQTNYVSAVGMAALGKRQSGRL